MKDIHDHILKTHFPRNEARTHTIRADTADSRSWLEGAPVCSALAEYNIAHCGIIHATYPMEVLRPDLSGTFFMSCTGGLGQVLIDGQWRSIGAKMACLQPPFIANGLRATKDSSWSFCWVRYREMARSRPIASPDSPTLGKFDSTGIHTALQGLFAEAAGAASAPALSHWAALVHGYVTTFAQPFQENERLRPVWDAVHAHLETQWSLEALADLACVSKEHLRRLTTQTLGRSPMQHVTYLRMKRASELLESTDHKIARIAREVGYANPFAFSNTFLRWSGFRPSHFRKPPSD